MQAGNREAGLGLVSLLFLVLFSACGLFEQPQATGSIVAHAQWPDVYSSTSDSNTAPRALSRNGVHLSTMPTAVTTVRASVSAPDITTPVVASFTASANSGTIDQVPVGSSRTLTLEGLNASNTVIFVGVKNNISVSTAAPADAGTVVMEQTPDATPPGDVTGFTATPGNTSVALAWTNPADADFQGVRIMRRGDGSPTGPLDGTLVYTGSATSHSETGLSSATTYYYKAFAYNSVPFFSAGTAVTALTTGSTSGNRTPTANDTTVFLKEDDTDIAVTLSANDPDAGTVLTYALVTPPPNGSLAGQAPNYTYTPKANFCCTDTFTFKVFDGELYSAVATVTLSLTANSDPPTATSATITTAEDTASAGDDPSVTDPDLGNPADSHTFAIVSNAPPSEGVGSVNASNQLVFTPAANWNGTTSFTFSATDNNNASVTGTADVTVTAVEDGGHTANPVNVTTDFETPVTVTLNATDLDPEQTATLVYTIVTGPLAADGAVGTVTGNQVTFTPATGKEGNATFTYKANDGTVDSNTATVTVTVGPGNKWDVGKWDQAKWQP